MEYLQKYWILIVLVFIGLAFIDSKLCLLLFSFIIIYISIDYYLGIKAIYKFGVETTGEILFYNRDGDGYKIPTIKYHVNGKEIQKEPFFYASTDVSKIRSYKSHINTSIIIRYDSEKPEKFVISSEKDFNFGSIVFIFLIGIIFFSVSVGGLLGYIDLNK